MSQLFELRKEYARDKEKHQHHVHALQRELELAKATYGGSIRELEARIGAPVIAEPTPE